jgi:type II secretion system protein L
MRAGSTLADAPRADTCRAVIEADLVSTQNVALPDLATRRLAPLLAGAVEAGTLEDAEQLHVTLLDHASDGQATCAVVSAPWLERVLASLATRGLHPEAAVSEGMLLPFEDDTWSVQANQNAYILRRGRHQAQVLDATEPPVALRLALARSPRPARIRVYQGNCLRMPDLELWRAELGVDLEVSGKWDWRAADWDDSADLLGGRFAARRAGLDPRAVLRPLLFGGLVLAAIQAAGVGLDAWILHRERTQLRAEQLQLARRALPAQAQVIDPALQVGDQLARLRAGAGTPGQEGMSALMARLGAIWQNMAAPRMRALTYGDAALAIEIDGRAETWIARLRADAQTVGLAISTSEGAAGTTITVRAAPGGRDGR